MKQPRGPRAGDHCKCRMGIEKSSHGWRGWKLRYVRGDNSESKNIEIDMERQMKILENATLRGGRERKR